MFTVHHQPQLAIWLKEQEKPHKLRAIMERERKEEFMRLAELKGYLKTLSQEDILKKGRTRSGRKANKLAQVGLIRMGNMKLMDMGEVGACSRLKVCIMPGNYLTRFDGLANCPELVKLDLHSNQITTLPGPDFWRMLPKLQMVCLHNNSIGKLECLQNMSTASNLQVLTLYDTPISLKKSYRHHVVNSVWALKALDNYVISDEEIIEDAIFGGHFGTMHPKLQYNPMPVSKKDNTVEDELALMKQVLQSIAAIQAKHSPVMIIQRYVRGYQARKRYKMYLNARIWASVCIQRYWRKYKGVKFSTFTRKSTRSRVSSSKTILRNSPTPTTIVQMILPDAPPSTATPGIKPDTAVSQNLHLDYDTYLKNRRPGSKSPSVVSSLPAGERRMGRFGPAVRELQGPGLRSSSPILEVSPSPVRKRTNLRIDLTKLETESQNVPVPDAAQAIVIETTIGVQESIDSIMKIKPGEKAPEPAQVKRLREKRENREKRRKKMEFKTVKQMLGRLPEDILDREQDISDDEEEDEPSVKFRVAVLKSVVHKPDPLQEMLMMKREVGHDIRHAHHKVIDKAAGLAAIPKPVKHKKTNSDQKMFARVQGTMGMACLRAVQQAYRDREKAEKHVGKSEYVAKLREQRQDGRRRSHNILEEKRIRAIKQKDIDLNEIADCLESQVAKEENEMKVRKHRRSKSCEISQNFQQQIEFSSDFISQQTSISNALLKHDRQSKRGEVLQSKVATVESNREHQSNQTDLVRRYLEHRKLMRQAQVAVERTSLDTRLLHEANERVLETRARVEQKKQKPQSVKAFYPLPKGATNPILPPVQLEGKPDKWNTLIAMFDGRVGNHPTLVTNG